MADTVTRLEAIARSLTTLADDHTTMLNLAERTYLRRDAEYLRALDARAPAAGDGQLDEFRRRLTEIDDAVQHRGPVAWGDAWDLANEVICELDRAANRITALELALLHSHRYETAPHGMGFKYVQWTEREVESVGIELPGTGNPNRPGDPAEPPVGAP